jgi:hypothetical protein
MSYDQLVARMIDLALGDWRKRTHRPPHKEHTPA